MTTDPRPVPAYCYSCERGLESQLKSMTTKGKNTAVLLEFIKYCLENRSYRFYQALAGFTGKQVLFWSKGKDEQGTFPPPGLEDRFYFEGKDK